jgi:BirA family biotin operon repressor/biotin-[acetyl-CoA-carboxylase] ligase
MVYLADEQTAGRGRGAHSWHSARAAGLYVSVLLRPRVAPADILWLSLAAGLAVREAVRQVTSLQADIRWPNDLLLGKKKFCGILTELNAEVTRVRHAVVGIGINVHQETFPAGLAPIAASLRSETGRAWARQDLLLALLQSLWQEAQALSAHPAGAAANILSRLEGASTWIRNRHVHVDEGEGYSGVTAGLDPRGFLQVRTPQGLRTVLSGGVREP